VDQSLKKEKPFEDVHIKLNVNLLPLGQGHFLHPRDNFGRRTLHVDDVIIPNIKALGHVVGVKI